MIFIDTGIGATINIGMEGDYTESLMKNIIVYGESEARDCFYENECLKRKHSGCRKRNALWITCPLKGPKESMVKTTLDLPYHSFMGDASYGARLYYTNMTFSGFPKT
jgi:hypothetical protein